MNTTLRILKSVVVIAICIGAIWFGLDNVVKKAYEDGRNSVTCKCDLREMCDAGLEESGFGANYEYGFKYQIFECGVKTGKARIEDDFIFEGSWDRCDSNGNCQPFVQDGEYVN
jgi:hypothetical protein